MITLIPLKLILINFNNKAQMKGFLWHLINNSSYTFKTKVKANNLRNLLWNLIKNNNKTSKANNKTNSLHLILMIIKILRRK